MAESAHSRKVRNKPSPQGESVKKMREYIDSVVSGQRVKDKLEALTGTKKRADTAKQARGMAKMPYNSRTEAGKNLEKAETEKKLAQLIKDNPKKTEAPKEPRTIAEAKKMGKSYFIGKDGKKKAAVTREELAASGLSLSEYLNKKKKSSKSPAKKSKGGMAKKYSKGGYANCGASVAPNGKSRT